MAQGYSAEMVGVLDGTLNPAGKADGRAINAKSRAFVATFDLSLAAVKKASGDTNVCFRVPVGYKFLYGIINASATMGASSTIAIGNSTTAAKYRAAAVFTAAAPTLFGLSTAADDAPLSADEDVIFTIGAADLPSSGILIVTMFFSAR
jgi:hypothetical protein